MPDEILTVSEAAKLLKISEKTFYNWVHIDGFPKLKVGNCIRIPRGLLMDWVNAQATKGEITQ
ncbi:MAG: helix-turn-helix domain-containing protein [Ruminococcaceae bacterium]|nr:helix-turn-helix domain-containing protein [Oscillospiraceae bacterium]